MWCCDTFERLLERAGEKGTSIIAVSDGQRRRFYIQARPFEKDVVEKYSAIKNNTGTNSWPRLTDSRGTPAPYVSVMQIPIFFCPSCGVNLEKMINSNLTEFDQLADLMKETCSG